MLQLRRGVWDGCGSQGGAWSVAGWKSAGGGDAAREKVKVPHLARCKIVFVPAPAPTSVSEMNLRAPRASLMASTSMPPAPVLTCVDTHVRGRWMDESYSSW